MSARAARAIDRESPVPLYHQVATALERAIRDGDYEVGELLEGEHQLAAQFGVSRLTLRKAVDGLVDNGLLVRERGVGTRVTRPRVTRSIVAPLTSLREDLERDGVEVSTKVLLLHERPCPARFAELFGVEAGHPMRYLERLRSVDGRPIALMRNLLPPDLLVATAQELEDRSLYDILRDSGATPRSAHQTISATLPDDEVAAQLDIPPSEPVLELERLGYDADGRCIEHSRTSYAAERYSFEMRLVES